MDLYEFYSNIDGDYEGVLGRLVSKERIVKYLNKFKTVDDMEQLPKAFEQNDFQEVFRITHNIKGISMNLGLTTLQNMSSELCELVRNGKPGIDISLMVDSAIEEYNRICIEIEKI